MKWVATERELGEAERNLQARHDRLVESLVVFPTGRLWGQKVYPDNAEYLRLFPELKTKPVQNRAQRRKKSS